MSRFVSLFFLLLALSAPLAAQQRSAAPLNIKIEATDAETLGPQLSAQVLTQLKRRLNLPQADLDTLDLSSVEQNAVQSLESLGYLSGKVGARIEAGEVRLRIVAGPQVKVREVSVEIITATQGEQQRLLTLVQDPIINPALLSKGQGFSAASWEKFKTESLAILQKRLYPTAAIEHSMAQLDEVSASADIKLSLRTGPVMRIGAINVQGLTRYRLNRVIDLMAIAPDSDFDAALLSRAQLSLLETRWFSSVTITPSVADNKVNLDVNVIERPSQRLTLGLGFSTDVGPRGRFAFEDTSIGPMGWAANTNLLLNRKEPSFELGVKTQANNRGTTFGSNLKYQQKDINGEALEQTSLTAYRNQTFFKFESVYSLTWQRERQLLGGVNLEKSRALVPGWSWNYRDLDDRINPRKGYTLGIQVSAASRNIASSTDFQRLYLRGAWLEPLGKASDSPVLALRSELGAVAATRIADVPSDNLFRSGGSNTLRGYGYQDIGQRVTNSNGTQSIIGGSKLATVSAELRVPLSRLTNSVSNQWEWSVFYDLGDANNSIQLNNLAGSAGTGLRFKTPVGPVGVDLAYGDRTKKWRLHFSVGFNL